MFAVFLAVRPFLPVWMYLTVIGIAVASAGLGSLLTWLFKSWRAGTLSASAAITATTISLLSVPVLVCCWDCGMWPEWLCFAF